MLTVSEETGELGEMLHQMSVFYEREVDYDLKRLNAFIEPALIICLSVVILMLAFAVYLPIWDLIKLAHT
jgi:MSHA biogenesis protein MshG